MKRLRLKGTLLAGVAVGFVSVGLLAGPAYADFDTNATLTVNGDAAGHPSALTTSGFGRVPIGADLAPWTGNVSDGMGYDSSNGNIAFSQQSCSDSLRAIIPADLPGVIFGDDGNVINLGLHCTTSPTGTIDPATGNGTMTVSLQVDVTDANHTWGVGGQDTCQLGPLPLTFTTGTSGPVTGRAFSPSAPTVGNPAVGNFVAGDFPALESGCSDFGASHLNNTLWGHDDPGGPGETSFQFETTITAS